MAVEIHVPALAESVSEAVVGNWLKQEGEFVESGDILLELETDKVNLEVAAPRSGVLKSINKQTGDVVQTEDVLGMIDDSQSAPKAKPETKSAPSTSKPQEAPKVAVTAAGEGGNATPTARRLAEQEKIELGTIVGTGIEGKVTKSDVEFAVAERDAYREGLESSAPQAEKPREEIVRLSRRRQTIAKRMSEAQSETVMTTTYNDIDMSAVTRIRSKYRDQFREKHGVKLGLMSFFIKAVVLALKNFPELNSELRGRDLVLKHYYNIGVAVASDEGLVVPVLRGAENMSFAGIEAAIVHLVNKVHDGRLEIQDLQDGTFTVTNGGVFGSLFSTPILNPPQVGILGMHAIKERPMVVDGKIEVRPMMYIALTYDHCVTEGSVAVRFLTKVKNMVEDPSLLMIDF